MLRNIGIPELILLIFLLVLLFGARRIPDIAENLGKALRKFKKASSETEEEDAKEEKSKTDDKK
ncbi:MAG: twin-arginine translocase TatA/TatE family subunit [Fibrobacteraceae bacterium]|nr:MAG: Sec-independent protein translocase TatA [Fibrobacteres bacterium CG2_30_45_31]